MSGDAITFALGGDNSGFLAVLNDTEQRAEHSTQKINKHLNSVEFEREGKVKRQISGLVADLAMAENGTAALGAAVIRLSETFKVGLSAGVAVGIGEVLRRQLEGAAKSVDEFSEKWRGMLSFNGRGASAGALQSGIENAQALAEEARKKSEDAFLGIGKSTFDAGEKSADEERDHLAELLIEKAERHLKITREQVDGSSRVAAQMQSQVDLEEKLNEIQNRKGLTPHEKARLQGVAKEEAYAQMDAQDRGANLLDIEQKRASQVQAAESYRAGNVGVNVAQANLEYAQLAKDQGGTKEQQADADLKVRQAQQALDLAKMELKERNAIIDAEREGVGVFASADVEQRMALERQVKLATELLDVYKDSTEEKKRQVDLEKAQAALAKFNYAQAQASASRAVDREEKVSESGENLSQSEQARIALVAAKKRSMLADGNDLASTDDKADAKAAVKAAEARVKAAEKDEEITRRVSQMTTDAMRLRISGREREASLVEKNAKTEADAARAEAAGHPEEAAQIRKRASLQQFGDNFNSAYDANRGVLDTHARLSDIRAKDSAEKKKSAAFDRFKRDAGLLSPQRNTAGDVIGGIDPENGEFVGSHDNNAPALSFDEKTGGRVSGKSSAKAPIGSFGEMPEAQSQAAANAAHKTNAAAAAAEAAKPGGNSELSQILGILRSWN